MPLFFENAPILGLHPAYQIQQLGVHIKNCDMVINPFKDILKVFSSNLVNG
jgi:hypothetical protein